MTGYEGTALDSLYPTNTDLFRKARAQGAATGYVHAFGGDGIRSKAASAEQRFPVDVALGTVDALEWSAASRGSLIPLFHAWNNDFRITPVGGEDSLANMQDNRPVGIIRTYACLGDEFTAAGWVNALKKGHTYLSSGPVVEFRVNGQMPGDKVRLAGGGRRSHDRGQSVGVDARAPGARLSRRQDMEAGGRRGSPKRHRYNRAAGSRWWWKPRNFRPRPCTPRRSPMRARLRRAAARSAAASPRDTSSHGSSGCAR